MFLIFFYVPNKAILLFIEHISKLHGKSVIWDVEASKSVKESSQRYLLVLVSKDFIGHIEAFANYIKKLVTK